MLEMFIDRHDLLLSDHTQFQPQCQHALFQPQQVPLIWVTCAQKAASYMLKPLLVFRAV